MELEILGELTRPEEATSTVSWSLIFQDQIERVSYTKVLEFK